MAGEGAAAGAHFVEENAEGKNVGAMVERAAGDLFRRHVGGCAQDDADLRLCGSHGGVAGGALGVDVFCEAEIEDFDAAVMGDHDVGGFEVAMDDALFVRGGERVGDSLGDFDDLRGRKATGVREAVERLAFDEFHGEEVDAFGFFDREDGDDVRMIERGDGTGFALEASEAIGVGRGVGRENFEGDVPLEFYVGGAIDLAHAAGAEGADDVVVG